MSQDLFHWSDIRSWENDSSVSLAAGQFPSGPLAQFTGTTQPVNLQGETNGDLLTFATGIHALPTNWKLPYIPGTEVQALYTSSDGGETWSEVGTVLPAPPEGWNVTGWRDPSYGPNANLDALLGLPEPHHYMVLGSGLKGPDVPVQLPGAARPGYIGPRMPLYAAPASNLTDWNFLGALWEPAANSSLGEPDVTGSYGYNFELTGFFNLPVPADGAGDAWIIIMGTEGGNTTLHVREQWSLWNWGTVSARANGSVEFVPVAGGASDWGLAYAQATQVDSRGRRLMWGWANEDLVGEWFFDVAKAMGYQGALTLPTELNIVETKGVVKREDEDEEESGITTDGTIWVKEQDDEDDDEATDSGDGGSGGGGRSGGAYTARTLGIAPLPEVLDTMREGSTQLTLCVGAVMSGRAKRALPCAGDSFELEATLSHFSGPAGIVVAQSPDDEEYTVIYFDPDTSTIGVDRSRSTSLSAFQSYTHLGHFAPYDMADGSTEKLNFRLVYDRSLLEVFVNGRFALTTRIYPSREDSTGISFYSGELCLGRGCGPACGYDNMAVWEHVEIYMGLADAWTHRPEDTSVPLLWDSPEDTGNYTWWAGFK